MIFRAGLTFLFLGFAFTGFETGAQAAQPRFKRVVHFVFENADYEDALKQPYFRRLADSGVLFTDSRAVTHPSQPNYIAMIAGSTLGVLLDGRVDLNERHLGDLLREKGLSWKAYAEGYPGNCFLGMRSGDYVRKHVPFLSFLSVSRNPTECAKVVNALEFFSDLAKGQLPAYSMFVPDLRNDGHDTGPEHSARWFEAQFGRVLSDPAFLGETLVIVTYDESESYLSKNQIYTVILGANTAPGMRVSSRIDHYSILALIEEGLGLGNLGRGDRAAAGSIPSIFR
jgi:hypothetical protein